MTVFNSYEDAKRAEAYAQLEFPDTYYLAYRDLPAIISEHTRGRKAIDFGCGAGRSTRFLEKLGFDAVGVDISEDMIKKAKEIDPNGNYHLIEEGNLSQFEDNGYDLILCAFTFDNIPSAEQKINILKEFKRLLKNDGRVVNLVSDPQIYVNEWASFSTKDFPENKLAKSGDKVKIIITAIDDSRPVEDLVCTDADYQEIFQKGGFDILQTHKPLAKESEPYAWVNETRINPWVIYLLKKTSEG
ncbi:MAG: class I SAM-dependent methyltransferase [Candidatus Omnitrophota bacterium]